MWRTLGFKAMGSPCALHLHPAPGVDVAAVGRACTVEALRLEQKYSRYRDDSVTSAINRSAGDSTGCEVDDETASLLDYAAIAHRESDGLFDITSGVLRRAWDFRSGRLPSSEALEAARSRVGWHRLEWRRPRLVLPTGMELDFGGFVKEYAADRLAELARECGVHHGLVDLGGDLAAIGPHPDGSPWQVGVRDPRDPRRAIAAVPLARGGIASSGDYERSMVVAGRRYCHILDPRTGWPVEGLASVSVVASHCLIAGTASTVAMLKGGGEGPRWLDTLGLPNVRVHPGGTLSGTRLAPMRHSYGPLDAL